MQYGVQLYTLRSLPPDERLPPVVEAGFEGVELVGLDPVDVGGLSTIGTHVDLARLEPDPAAAVERCRANETETVVVPALDPAAFADATVDETAARLDRVAEAVADAGARLCYHNHEFEFEWRSASAATSETRDEAGVGSGHETASGADAAGGDRDEGKADGHPAGTPFDRLVSETTRLTFEIDVGWATTAGVDPVALLERVGARTPLVHLKDVRLDPTAPRGGRPVDLGTGDVDLRGCLRAAEAADVEWIVFEHDDPTHPEKSVGDAAAWLRAEASEPR